MSSEFLISVVIPIFNEEQGLGELFSRLQKVLTAMDSLWELVFVNDGSKDASLAALKALKEENPQLKITIVDLSRNFGHQIALTAGVDFARGDAVVTMDADLQDPPEVIPELVAKWRQGYDVVHAKRRTREGETLFKLFTAGIFYRLLRALSDVDLPVNVGDFRLMSAKAVKALGQIRERHRYVRGLVSWLGFRQTTIEFDRQTRFAGGSKYPLLKMIRLSLDALTGFSLVPLRLASWLGISSAAAAICYLIYALYIKFILKIAILGWTSVVFAVVGIGGIQLICLGIIGEYIGIMYSESKQRPLYLINEIASCEETHA